MSGEDALARLTAGLAEDEAAAQEALSLEEPYRQLLDEGISVTIRYEWVRHTKLSTGGRGSMFLDGAPDPRRVLCQVEAAREVIADHQSDEGYCTRCWDGDSYAPASQPWPCPTIRALAGIYTEPTEEKL